MEKSICLDASALLKSKPTGVELYSQTILPKLSEELLNMGFEVIWCAPGEINNVDSRIKQITIPAKKLWTQTVLLRKLNELKPDLYFSPSNFPPLLYMGRAISIVHDMALYHNPANFSFSQKILLGYFGKMAVSKSLKVIVPSRYTGMDLEKHWEISNRKIEVIHMGMFELKDNLEEVPKLVGQNYYLSVGRIENKKNLQVIINLFKSLKSNDVLVLAGSNGLGAKKIIDLIDGSSKIILLGYVSSGQKKWLYQNAKAVIVPGQYEGFGFPVLEAFQSGIIPICSNQGSLPEIAGNAAIYVENNTVKGWSAAINKLEDKDLSQSLISNGKIKLKEYTWEEAVQKMVKIILQVTNTNE